MPVDRLRTAVAPSGQLQPTHHPDPRRPDTDASCADLASAALASRDWEQLSERLAPTRRRAGAWARRSASEPSLDPDLPRIETRRDASASLPALPWPGQWLCTGCNQTVSGRVIGDEVSGGVQLLVDCPSCGPVREAVDARSAPRGAPPAVVAAVARNAAKRNGTGAERALRATLIETICPECERPLFGRRFVCSGVVYSERTCPMHGYFRDVCEADAGFYCRLHVRRATPTAAAAGAGSPAGAVDSSERRIELRADAGSEDERLAACAAAIAEAKRDGRCTAICVEVDRAALRRFVPEILSLCVEARGVVRELEFSTLAFDRPVSQQQAADLRCSLSEIAAALAGAAGAEVTRDFHPPAMLDVWPRLLSLLHGGRVAPRSGLDLLSFAGYLLIAPSGRVTPVSSVFRMPALLDHVRGLASRIETRRGTARVGWRERVLLALRLSRIYAAPQRGDWLAPLRILGALNSLLAAGRSPNGVQLLRVVGRRPMDRYSVEAASGADTA